MGVVVVALVASVLFVALICWLIVSNLMNEKDCIIDAHLHSIVHLEKSIEQTTKEEHQHKLWLVDVAHLIQITEIKKQLLGYAQPTQPKNSVDPKAKK